MVHILRLIGELQARGTHAVVHRIHVDLPRHVTLQLELVTDAHQLILLMLEDILDYVKEGFLAEMHESVQDF